MTDSPTTPPGPLDVAVIGSSNLDLVVSTERHPLPGETVIGGQYAEHPGGKGLNQAVASARAGASTALIGALGDDEAGTRLRQIAVDDRIDVSRLVVVEALPTGRALITVDSRGENSIVVVPGANAAVAPGALPDCRVALVQLEIPLDAVTRYVTSAREQGAITVLNPAPAMPLPGELLARCDVVIPNEHEVDLLGGVDHLLALGVGAVVVTLGKAGAAIHRAGAETVNVAAIPAVAVDTTGAGDAFCGNLAARLAAGHDLVDAARWAVAAGSLTVRTRGAVPSLPFATDVRSVLSGE